MKVEYEKSMMERLLDAAQDAKLNHKVVRCVKLCESEWDQLYNETEIIVFPTCDHQAKNPIKIYGMRIEYSDQKTSTVNYEYDECEGTGYQSMIRDLEDQNAKLRKQGDDDNLTIECLQSSIACNSKVLSMYRGASRNPDDIRMIQELRKEKETLLEMNRKQVGMIKKQTSLKEEALKEVGDLRMESRAKLFL